MYGIELPVHITAMHITKPRLDVFYPTTVGMKDPKVQQKINNTILETFNRMINEQGYYQDPMTEISGSYEIKTNERGIISICLIIDAYSGGAHGIRVIRSLTIEADTGKVYELKDLFKQNENYVKRLSVIVSKQIADRGIYLLGQFIGIRPDQDFYLSDKTIVIYFQLYEITPYAFGFPYFPISIYEIKDIIDEKGPLKILSY